MTGAMTLGEITHALEERVDLADQHGADGAVAVPGQPFGQPLRVGGRDAEIQFLDRDAKRAGRCRPAAPEMPRGQHQPPRPGGRDAVRIAAKGRRDGLGIQRLHGGGPYPVQGCGQDGQRAGNHPIRQKLSLRNRLTQGTIPPKANRNSSAQTGVTMKRILLVSAVACTCLAPAAMAETAVKFGTNWVAQGEHGGFYQAVDAKGAWVPGSAMSPGYTVNIGWDNFLRVLQDKGIQQPFVKIFIWTVLFSGLTVLFTLAIGMVLACLVQWQPLRGKGVYRLLLILPYAVPGFISILIFKGLFNQSFGEINLVLEQLLGIKPTWFTDPLLAKAMILIVNVWLGYPYMMILCMGLLKAIPDDLYEASALDGATPMQNFFRITLPLLIKPLTPLLIACFAFNFNNFVLIQLLTNGGPNMLGTSTPAGNTDLLVSYTYRIAFEGGGGQDFGLAAAIATLIFLLVGGLAILNLKASKLSLEQ